MVIHPHVAHLVRASADGKVVQTRHDSWVDLTLEGVMRHYLDGRLANTDNYRVKSDPVTKHQALEALLLVWQHDERGNATLRRFIEEQA